MNIIRALKIFCLVLAIGLLVNIYPLASLAGNCTNTTGSCTSLDNPLGSNDLSPQQIYGRIIYAFMGVTGTVALLMFVIGGFQWMTAAGSPEKIKKGRDTLMWAVLGLVVIFSSYAILKAILETIKF